jgi:hypothetical protein
MPKAITDDNPDDLADKAAEVYARRVRPALRQEDDGKFVAIDLESGEYEIDPDDYTAVMRLRARRPDAEIWLERAGHPTAVLLRCSR